MADHFQTIYAGKAALYDAMVSHEDYQGNILPALEVICPLNGAAVVEMGAGTGRLTRLLVPVVRSIRAFDLYPAMLVQARQRLDVPYGVGDNRRLPVKSACVDVVVAGWSFGHATGWMPDHWRDEIGRMVDEMERVLQPGGMAIILETMGTGSESPAPPNEALAAYYRWLEDERGFAYRWIRTDYRFESVQEAERLTRFFFGADLADRILREKLTILPECTGIWSRTG